MMEDIKKNCDARRQVESGDEMFSAVAIQYEDLLIMNEGSHRVKYCLIRRVWFIFKHMMLS